jgi:hypothetical protein
LIKAIEWCIMYIIIIKNIYVVGFHDDFNGMPLTLHQQQHLGWWEVPLHGLNNVLFADASLYWNGRAQVCCWWRVYWLIWCVKCDGLSQNRITYEGKSCFCCWWPGTLHIFRYRYSVITFFCISKIVFKYSTIILNQWLTKC